MHKDLPNSMGEQILGGERSKARFLIDIFFYQKIKIIVQRKIALIVKVVISRARFGGVGTGEVVKTETQPQQFVLGSLGFVFRIEPLQDAIVLPKAIVDIADQVARILVEGIVMRIPTGVAAEFLVGPTPDSISALYTASFHNLKI